MINTTDVSKYFQSGLASAFGDYAGLVVATNNIDISAVYLNAAIGTTPQTTPEKPKTSEDILLDEMLNPKGKLWLTAPGKTF